MHDYMRKGQIYQKENIFYYFPGKFVENKMLNKIFVVILYFWRVVVGKSGPFFNSFQIPSIICCGQLKI